MVKGVMWMELVMVVVGLMSLLKRNTKTSHSGHPLHWHIPLGGSIIDVQKGALWVEGVVSDGLIRGEGRVDGRYAL